MFLKLCTKCKIPVILHLKESTEDEDPECDNLLSKLVDNYQIPLQNNAQIEDFNELFDIEIRVNLKMPRRSWRKLRLGPVCAKEFSYQPLDSKITKEHVMWRKHNQ